MRGGLSVTFNKEFKNLQLHLLTHVKATNCLVYTEVLPCVSYPKLRTHFFFSVKTRPKAAGCQFQEWEQAEKSGEEAHLHEFITQQTWRLMHLVVSFTPMESECYVGVNH